MAASANTVSSAVAAIGEQAQAVARDVLVAEAERVYAEALAAWPVSRRPRTLRHPGHSRDTMRFEIVQGAGTLGVRFFNDAAYTLYIKGKAQGGRSTWRALVVLPVRRVEREAAIAIVEEVTRG